MSLIQILGYAGLLPFIGLTCLQLWPQLATFPASFIAFQSYSQIILAFMAGVLWPVLYRHSGKLFPLWVVSFALAGWFSSLLLPKQQLLVLAAAFAALRLFEYTQQSQLNYSPAYNRLRNHLTTAAVICHLVYWMSL